jgi:sulfoxide reductase catalytic subunit YedY
MADMNINATFKRLPKLKPVDPSTYWGRRNFLKQMGFGGAALAGLGAVAGPGLGSSAHGEIIKPDDKRYPVIAPALKKKEILAKFPYKRNADFNPKGMKLTDQLAAGSHNNFYEFLPGQGGPVWRLTGKFKVDPWKVEVTGLCEKPTTFDLDDLFKFDQEERVYKFRCVETWAMNVPWTGFPLSKLLDKVKPKSSAKFVRFTTASEKSQMGGIQYSIDRGHGYAWPYSEALRMDEAMNELTLMTTGVFGQPLPKQHGAPVRLITPWKYGYKSAKSIVKIELIAKQPDTFWGRAPYLHEYGFLSNVNPNVPHPRWSQAGEYMLIQGASRLTAPRRKTELFNGYSKFVGKMYPKEPTTPQQPLQPGQTAR